MAVLCLVLLAAESALADQGTPSSGGSVLNILLLGVIAYFLVRMFRRRMGGGNGKSGSDKTSEKRSEGNEKGRVIRPMDRHEAARQMWGHLSSDSQGTAQEAVTPTMRVDGFNENEFLEGAKLFFARFQQASDSRDFDELKVFLSDEVYTDAVLRAQDNPAHVRTEIMLLNARLMELNPGDGMTAATVFYDAQVRKGISGDQPVHMRAVWEFSRDDSVENGLWKLEKINKVDQ